MPIIWQRLVSADGRTCLRCDATYQHQQSAVAKLKGALDGGIRSTGLPRKAWAEGFTGNVG